jgi:Beta-lactamase class C and other penicillin binding proteins
MKKNISYLFFVVITAALLIPYNSNAQNKSNTQISLEKTNPESVGINSNKLKRADEVINAAIKNKEIPGAVLAIVRENKIAYLKAYGNKSVYPKVEPMTVNTVFDMASCSKVMGTTISIMQLLERGYIRLTDNVKMYVPGFKPYYDSVSGEKIDIRIVDLLTHSSGLPPYVSPDVIIKKYGNSNPSSLLNWISNCKRDFKPTTDFQYSCLNFITLQNILQNILGENLSDYAQKNIFDVLGMKHTTYSPKAQNKGRYNETCCTNRKTKGWKCFTWRSS